jgi:hypothetical protein
MKKKSGEIVVLKELKKVEKKILISLGDILTISMDSIIPMLSTFLLEKPLFIPPITSILNSFIKGYASFRDFREFEMIVSFVDTIQSKSSTEISNFNKIIEDDFELVKKITYYVTQQNDVLKSRLIGNIYKAYSNSRINKEELTKVLLLINKIDWDLILTFSVIVENILISDDHLDHFYQSEKKDSWECLDIKWSNLNIETFGKSKNKLLSAGLINETLFIQPITKVLGSYKEENQIKRLREASQNVQINFNFSYEGFLIIRFGNIKNIDENYSLY